MIGDGPIIEQNLEILLGDYPIRVENIPQSIQSSVLKKWRSSSPVTQITLNYNQVFHSIFITTTIIDTNANSSTNFSTTLDQMAIAARGNDIKGLDIFQKQQTTLSSLE
jgi:hypothetical protein